MNKNKAREINILTPVSSQYSQSVRHSFLNHRTGTLKTKVFSWIKETEIEEILP